MEAEPRDEFSLSIPLLDDAKQQKLEGVESNSRLPSSTGTTSFFKTCFNGLNSLSGFDSMLSALHLHLCINGSFGVLNVWVRDTIPDNSKPPNR
ncbi:hypothetical protein L1049_003098 [Liquidambar formosana]|uniref:Uncharacterized protein n=1 Tax=Liquidambar formosana TaxID=63359 RepID=A0AAP0NIJ1_LIQFO